MPFRPSPAGIHPATTATAVRLAALALAVASLVAAAAVGSIFLSTARDAWTAIDAPGPAGPADGILLVGALGGALLSLWLGLAMTLSALSGLPGALGHACSQLAARIAPAAVRKVVAFVLGTTLTAALVPGTAVARIDRETPRPAVVASGQLADGAVHAVGTVGSVKGIDAAPSASFRFVSGPADGIDGAESVDAAPGPSWSPKGSASVKGQAAPIDLVSRGAGSSESAAAAAGSVVVLRGDTLWSIAAHRLGRAATNADIDAEWRRWFAANRDVIGADANLISPGQQLRPPAPTLSPPPAPRGDS